MFHLIKRKAVFGLYFTLALFIASSASHAAPPNPRLFLKQIERALKPSLNMMAPASVHLADPDSPKTGYSPQPDGIEYILAILVDFSDQPAQKPISVFDNAIFGTDGTSMRLYYEEVSYGQMHIRPGYLGGVMPRDGNWYRASKRMSYYGRGSGTVMTERYAELALEACEAADAQVDFTRYDRDGDGYIDHLMLIHAGDDEASSGVPEDIWSAVISQDVVDIPGVYDGVRISSVMVVAEDPSNDFINVGIYCHEFFHEFGAPDLYSWNYPVGHWCLMGYFGPYQDDGRYPSHICGYLKWDFDADPFNGIQGWMEPEELTRHGSYSLDSFELPEGDRLYKIDIPGKLGREYFLMENRNKNSGAVYDTHIPESGVVIWHIDENSPLAFTNSGRAWVEDPADPEHSGFGKTTSGAAYSSDDGQTAFTPATQPDSSTSDGEYSGIIITDIGAEGASMSFTYFFGDTYEPNDSISDAYGLLQYGQKYSSYIRDDSDIDFYKFHVQSDFNIIVYLEDIPEGSDYDLQVFNSRGDIVDSSIEEWQTEEILNLRTNTSGVYYLAVISKSGYNSSQPYYLTVDSIPLAPGIIAVANVYPNPGPSGNRNIWFDYKLLNTVEQISLDIYTVAGDLIYNHSTSDLGRIGRISWDARTETGEMVAPGVYVYILKADLNGETDMKTGKIAVVY